MVKLTDNPTEKKKSKRVRPTVKAHNDYIEVCHLLEISPDSHGAADALRALLDISHDEREENASLVELQRSHATVIRALKERIHEALEARKTAELQAVDYLTEIALLREKVKSYEQE